MTVYIIQLFLVFVLSPIQRVSFRFHKKFKGKDIYLWSVFSFLFVVMALRDSSIGSDTLSYTWINSNIANSSDYESALISSSIFSSPIYVGVHYFISRIIYSEQMGIAVNSAIVCIGFYYYIKKYSHNYVMSIFLFIALCLYFESMNGTRQFMAIALALNAYELLKQNCKSLVGWMLFILAIGVHNTIIAFAVALVGIMIRRKLSSIQNVVGISIVVSSLVIAGYSLMVDIFVKIFPYFVIYLDGTNKAQIFQSEGSGRIILLYIVLGFFIYFINYFLEKKWIDKNNKIDLLTCLLCVFLGMFFSSNILVTRILWPFLCVFIVYLPNCLSVLKNQPKILMYGFVICSLSIYCILFLAEDKSGIIPYMIFHTN